MDRLMITGLVLLLCGGCGVFRGIPSHGGGKRFDEEQRVVAGAIRQSLSQMDLSPLAGKRVQIVVDSIAQDGGGNFTPPGLQTFGVNGSLSNYAGNVLRLDRESDQIKTDDTRTETNGVSGYMNWQVNPNYTSHLFSTSGDLAYLRASLDMKARLDGLLLTGQEPQVVVFVLVDILGTNRSRSDRLVISSDALAATCETTWYATSADGREVILPARRTAATAFYRETRGLGVQGVQIVRSLNRSDPSPFGEHLAESRVGLPRASKEQAPTTGGQASTYLMD